MPYTLAEVRDLLLPLALSCGYHDVRVSADASRFGQTYWASAHSASGSVLLTDSLNHDTAESMLAAAWETLYGKVVPVGSL